MGPGSIGSVEAVEQPVQDLGIDVGASVFHGHCRSLCRTGDVNSDISSLGRVAHGIGQQVAHRTAEHEAIAFNLAIAFQLEPDALFLGYGLIKLQQC